MPKLTIVDDDGNELVSAHIADRINPATVTIAVLNAVAALEPPKKRRSDAGKPRAPKLPVNTEPAL